MTIENLKAKTKEMNIATTARAYSVSVAEVCSEEGFLEFGINSKAVDCLVVEMSKLLQHFRPDEVVTALGIMFVFCCRRFQFHVPSYLRFIENFLYRSTDIKLGCHAVERLFGCLYQDHVIRTERVDFNHTRTIKMTRSGFDKRQRDFS